MAVVQSVEVQILESEALQANAIIRGQLSDGGCTTISSVDQVRNGNTFNITLMTTTDPLAICTLAATPFEQVVSLEVSNLPPATYIVNANGVEAKFELLPSNASTFQQVLVDALNRRHYELQKVMMDDLFTIGYWLSEGTENTREEAIDQLQKNLLRSTSPITADYNKNLSDLLGNDPGTILGADIGKASPIFVTGLGAEGKDEGTLFVAKQPDGGLYWLGLLFPCRYECLSNQHQVCDGVAGCQYPKWAQQSIQYRWLYCCWTDRSSDRRQCGRELVAGDLPGQ